MWDATATAGGPRTAPPQFDRVLGLDEAGRGSFVGPLIVGGFVARSDQREALRALGVKDSKLLSRTRREELYDQLGDLGERYTVCLDPAVVDRSVRRGELNLLEAKAFADVIRQAAPDRVVADACDVNARRFASRLAAFSGSAVPILARHHADRDDPVVGAASIVAKVSRDRAIDRLASDLGVSVGSGYPSDVRTVEFVRSHLVEHPAPSFVRFSWATVERVKPKFSGPTLDELLP
ncbi:MAG: ribonuclease HII [Thermoplasmata archaeon]|nr:ribonuclease HII [Thermoplasmata archaeon]